LLLLLLLRPCIRRLFADSTSEAKEVANSDPLHAAGIRKFEMLPWVQQLHW
jgi:hypothetical protein